MKEKLVLLVGLILVAGIAVVVINGNNECSSYEAKALEATNGVLLQQKDVLIAKLMNQVKAKQAELDGLKADLVAAKNKLDENKAEFEEAKKKLDNIRAEVNSPIRASASKK